VGDGIEVNPLAWAAIEDVSNKIKITGGAGQSVTYDTTYTILILYFIILFLLLFKNNFANDLTFLIT